jgi:chromosome segregation ATPase
MTSKLVSGWCSSVVLGLGRELPLSEPYALLEYLSYDERAMTDHLKALFDHLRQADQQLADQEVSLEEVRRQRQAAHDALWTAIEAELDTTASVHDLQESVRQLQSLVLELTARLPPKTDD